MSDTMTDLWYVRLTCCGRDNGVYTTDSWKDADEFRESYLHGPGVFDPHSPYAGGHVRTAIIDKVEVSDE